MLIGYARISRPTQKLDLQIDALLKAGCKKIFHEQISGAKAKRPQLEELLRFIRPDDVLVIWKLDRLGRTMKELIKIVEGLEERGIGLRSLNDPIDTSSPSGKLVFQIFCALAEFERNVIRERCAAGLEAARARGRLGGRPKGLSKEGKRKALAAETLYREQRLTVDQICDELSIAKSTLYKYLRYRKVEISPYKVTRPRTRRAFEVEPGEERKD